MHSSSFSLLRSFKILLVEDSSSELSVRIFAVLSQTLKVQSKRSTSSRLVIIVYPFSFSISFLKKLIKVPSTSLSGLSSFLSCAKTEYDTLLSTNLLVHQVTSLINYAVSSIPSGGSYLYQILSTSQNTRCSAYSSSISADAFLSTIIIRKVNTYLVTTFDWYISLNIT